MSPNTGSDPDLAQLLAAGLSPKTAHITIKYLRHKGRMVRKAGINDPAKAAEWAHEAIMNAWDRRVLSTEEAKELLIDVGFDAEAHRLDMSGPRPRRNVLRHLVDRILFG